MRNTCTAQTAKQYIDFDPDPFFNQIIKQRRWYFILNLIFTELKFLKIAFLVTANDTFSISKTQESSPKH